MKKILGLLGALCLTTSAGASLVACTNKKMGQKFDELEKDLERLIDKYSILEKQKDKIGDKGDKGDPGKDGTNGRDDIDGKSAYDLAREKGYQGTLEEWLEALKGDKGDPGKDGTNGRDGKNGKDGKSIDPKEIQKKIDELFKKQQKENENKINDLIYKNYFSHLDFLETIKSTGKLSDNQKNKRNELRSAIFAEVIKNIKIKLQEKIIVFSREQVMEGFLNSSTGKYAKEVHLLGITYRFGDYFKSSVKIILLENGQWADTVDIEFRSILS